MGVNVVMEMAVRCFCVSKNIIDIFGETERLEALPVVSVFQRYGPHGAWQPDRRAASPATGVHESSESARIQRPDTWKTPL